MSPLTERAWARSQATSESVTSPLTDCRSTDRAFVFFRTTFPLTLPAVSTSSEATSAAATSPETLLILTRCGVPAAVDAFRAAREVFAEIDAGG